MTLMAVAIPVVTPRVFVGMMGNVPIEMTAVMAMFIMSGLAHTGHENQCGCEQHDQKLFTHLESPDWIETWHVVYGCNDELLLNQETARVWEIVRKMNQDIVPVCVNYYRSAEFNEWVTIWDLL